MEKMCHPLAMAIFDNQKDDPIARFDDHERALLESALSNPLQTFDGRELYPTLVKKAAMLYYSLNKNHPFKNGNKRIATASLLVFLYINDQDLNGGEREVDDYLFDLALKVANSSSGEKDLILKDLEQWIEKHMGMRVEQSNL